MCCLLHCVICLHEAEQSFFFQGTFQHDAWRCHTFHNLRSWVLNMFSLFLQFANLQVMTTWVVTQMFGKKKLHLQGSLRSSHDNSFVKQSASSSPWWSCGFATSVELKQFRVGYYMVGFVEFYLTGSCRRAVVTPMSPLCTKYKMFSEMLGDTQTKVTGQAKQIHQSCCLPGRSVMNNLSGMMDVSDVWLPWITAVTEACHEGQRCTLKDEALSSHQAPFDLSIRLPAVLGDNGAQ